MPVQRILLADSRPVRRQRLAIEIAARPELRLAAACGSLMETYSLVESGLADAVVVCAEFRQAPEFKMCVDLAALLGVALVPLADGLDSPGAIAEALTRLPRAATVLPRPPRPAALAPPLLGDDPIIVIGASTGGVEALHRLLAAFPGDCPPTLVVQHIRGDFSAAFADRLDRACKATVAVAEDGRALARGVILVAPGDACHLELRHPAASCRLVAAPPMTGHRPSVDALFRSAAEHGPRIVGVLLTGMGRDGARGLLAIRAAGGHTIAQDRDSSTVYGMPRVAAELGAAVEVLALDRIADAALRAAARGRHRSTA